MRFKGDIIITDPCYICKESEYRDNNISDWELCNYGEDMEVLGIKKLYL